MLRRAFLMGKFRFWSVVLALLVLRTLLACVRRRSLAHVELLLHRLGRYWCVLCVRFAAPQSVCVCQTCKAMVCTKSHCAVPTTGEGASLKKFECKSCWCDRWYASVKDNAGDMLLGCRVFPGAVWVLLLAVGACPCQYLICDLARCMHSTAPCLHHLSPLRSGVHDRATARVVSCAFLPHKYDRTAAHEAY